MAGLEEAWDQGLAEVMEVMEEEWDDAMEEALVGAWAADLAP